jgi:hypothetical protein
MNRGNLWF